MVITLLQWTLTPGPCRLCRHHADVSATLLALAMVAAPAQAQLFTWSNPADGNWSVGSNWVDGIPPSSAATAELVFGSPSTRSASYTAINDIASSFQLGSLTFNNTAGLATIAGSGLSFVGANSMLTQSGTGAALIDTPVTLTAATTMDGSGTGTVTFNRAVNGGTNNLIKTSAGSLVLADGGSLNMLQLTAGTTNVTGGTLTLSLRDNTSASLLLGTAAGEAVVLNQTGGRINFAENARIASAAGSAATVTVTGAGTVLDNTLTGTTGQMRVGGNGAGTLNVTAGGVVNSHNLYIGALAGSIGNVVIDGAGSTVNSSFMFRVGNAGTGTLTVRNGGTLNAGTVGAQFALIVGNVGVGTLTASDGGTVTSPVAYIGYGGDGGVAGVGTFTVTGTGSTLTVGTPTSVGELGVGITAAGDGILNIQDGGHVTVNGSARGAYFNGRGVFNVTDAGSLLHVTGRLSLGGEFSDSVGTATLNVGSGGTVTIVGRVQLQNASTINLNSGRVMSLGSLADGPRNTPGIVNLAADTTLTIGEGTGSFRGVIRGAGALAKTGSGVQTLAGFNTFTGNTTLSAGTLRLSGNGSLASSPRVALSNEAVLDVTAVTGGANFSNGGFALATNQTLAGHGTVLGPVTIVDNATISPGIDGIGQLDLGNSTWTGGGRYVFEFSSLTPSPGTTNDVINGTGALTLMATAASPFLIDIRGINLASTVTGPVSFTIATFSGGVSGFDPAAFAYPTREWLADTPKIALQGNSLVLTFIAVRPGDFDQDGEVDADDYITWRTSYGSTVINPGDGADGNRDGFVDAADYVIWRNDLGAEATVAGSTVARINAPEPPTVILLLLLIVCGVHKSFFGLRYTQSTRLSARHRRFVAFAKCVDRTV